jgi:hypothetical protein
MRPRSSRATSGENFANLLFRRKTFYTEEIYIPEFGQMSIQNLQTQGIGRYYNYAINLMVPSTLTGLDSWHKTKGHSGPIYELVERNILATTRVTTPKRYTENSSN